MGGKAASLAPAGRVALAVMRCEIGAEETGDPLAGRDIHLVQRKLDSLARVGLMRAELQERHDSPEPEAMLNIRVEEFGDVVPGILEFGKVGGELAAGTGGA